MSLIKIRKAKRTFRKKLNRKTMIAGGLGSYGPYLLVNKKIGRRSSVKASIGTKGAIIGGKYKNKRIVASVDYNLTTKSIKPSLKFKKKKR